jgi:hypothetical protein
VCRIDRFIQGGSVINSQRLCHLGVTIEAHKGKAGGERAEPYRSLWTSFSPAASLKNLLGAGEAVS